MNEENKISFGYLLKAYGLYILINFIPLFYALKTAGSDGHGMVGMFILITFVSHLILALIYFSLLIKRLQRTLWVRSLITFTPFIILFSLLCGFMMFELSGFIEFSIFLLPALIFSILFLMHLNKKLNRTGLKRDSSVVPPSE